jgi:hypothetical protein
MSFGVVQRLQTFNGRVLMRHKYCIRSPEPGSSCIISSYKRRIHVGNGRFKNKSHGFGTKTKSFPRDSVLFPTVNFKTFF